MRAPIAVLVAAVLSFLPRPAGAQTARSMDIDTSIRSLGMASASTAVFFGDDLNSWANPALLGYAEGVRYQREHTQFIPDLVPDVFFDTENLRFGGGGVGIVVAGQPVLKGVEFDYGTSGYGVHSTESVESWGIGVSLARAAEALMRARGRTAPDWSRHVDVSLGMNLKHTEILLSPTIQSAANTFDAGVLVRATLLDRPGADGAIPVHLDLAIAYAMLNAGDRQFYFPASGESAPPTRQHRIGIAARYSLDPPLASLGRLESRPWFLRGLTPVLQLGVSADAVGATPAGVPARTWWAEGFGTEAVVFSLLTLRVGYDNDKPGQIQDFSYGIGVALPIGRVAGVRFDHASFPQAKDSGLADISRDSFTAWIDPLEMWRLSRAKSARAN